MALLNALARLKPKGGREGVLIDGDLGSMPLDDAIAKLQEEVAGRVIRQIVKSDFSGLESSHTRDATRYLCLL